MKSILEKYKRRDSSVEILRIIACFIVVSVHIKLGITKADNSADFSRILVSCFVADGVGIFWMISGFYLNRQSDYLKQQISTLKKIVFPAIAYVIIVILYMHLADKMNFSDIFFSLNFDITNLQNYIRYTNHMWYIYIFIFISLLLPLLKQIIEYLDKHNGWKIFLPLTLFLLLWNDIKNNALCEFSHHSISALVPSIIVMIIGYFVYTRIISNPKKFTLLLSFFIFATTNIVRAICEYNNYNESASIHVLFWYSLFGIISSSSFATFVILLFRKIKKSIFINYIASKTYLIYLIHVLFIMIFNKYQIDIYFQNLISSIDKGGIGDVLYVLIYGAVIFITSLLTTIVLDLIKTPFLIIKEKSIKSPN